MSECANCLLFHAQVLADEITSSMDERLERMVYEHLCRIVPTIVSIGDASVVLYCDIILSPSRLFMNRSSQYIEDLSHT